MFVLFCFGPTSCFCLGSSAAGGGALRCFNSGGALAWLGGIRHDDGKLVGGSRVLRCGNGGGDLRFRWGIWVGSWPVGSTLSAGFGGGLED